MVSGHRGIFCVFEDQRWAPGSDPWLRAREAVWLQALFPATGTGGKMLGAEGAVWIRRVEGRWLACHVCIPEMSRLRSTPSWAVAVVEDGDFRRRGLLQSVVADVRLGARSPDRWVASGPRWTEEPWDRLAVAKVAAMFDRALRAGGSGAGPRLTYPESWLDRSGWLALQQVLLAMLEFGIESPAAVIVGDPGWELPASAVPADGVHEFRRDAVSAMPAPGQPVARGVEVSAFVNDFPGCADLLRRVLALQAASEDSPESFAEAVGPCVPLASIDPSRLRREEWAEWAASALPAVDAADPWIDRLVRRVEAGDRDIVPPVLRVLAEWGGRGMDQGAGPSRVRRLDEWVRRLTRAR
jgi:hypothetical protein